MKRAARTQDHSVNYGRIMRAIRGKRTVKQFAQDLGVTVMAVRRAEEGWLPNFRCGGNIAEKAGISGWRCDYADRTAKRLGQVRVGL